jgi:cyanophycinase
MGDRFCWACALATTFVLAGCSSPHAGGTLVIAGGGLDAHAERVYTTFLDHAADGAILIVPSASASPARSAEGVEERLRTIDPNCETVVYPEVIEAMGGAWFTGGQQSRLADSLGLPPGKGLFQAILDRGGAVGGTSAGAAIMSSDMIVGGGSAQVLLRGTVSLRRGLGVFPYGIVDQHFLRRGRLGRLVVALEQAERAHGFGIEEGCAIVVDLQRHQIEVIGDGGLVFVDASESDGLRLSWYADGAILDARSGRLLDGGAPIRNHRRNLVVMEGDPWAARRIQRALAVLERGEAQVVEVRGDDVLVRLALDEESRLTTTSPPSLLGIRLDLEKTSPRPAQHP